MKKRGILIVGVALLLATAGVVYAHWTDTLRVNAVVNTGDVDVVWQAAGTDDDGIVGNDLSGNDNNLMTQIYDAWPAFPPSASSSADPSEMGQMGYDGGSLDRYDKDVARCAVTASADSKELTVTITGAYPSYHCTVFATYINGGSVPVKSTAFVIQEYRGTVPLVFPDMLNTPVPPAVTYELGSAYSSNDMCGTQIDPGGSLGIKIGFHIGQAAAENATYRIVWSTDFVNWNEWDDDLCHYTINGEPLF